MVMNMAPVPNVSQPYPLPYFGLTSAERTTQAFVPGIAGGPTATSTPAYDPFNRLPSMAFLSRQTNGAISAANDPTTWTPGEAAAQTDRALARIAQANPELAQKLAEQRGKSEGEDLPWWKDILSGVGEVLHATKLDVVFEVLGRSAKIVPEIIHDWGKESVWKNFGDALSGHSVISWDDVLVDNFGMERSWLTAALGFVGDVATDPLTYATFGMGGVGRAAAGKVVAEAGLSAALKEGSLKVTGEVAERLAAAGVHVAENGMLDLSLMGQEVLAALDDKFVAAVIKGGGTQEDAIARAIFSLTDSGKTLAERGGAGLSGRIRGVLERVHPDARPGALFTMDNIGSQHALQQALRFQDDLYRQATTGGWNRISAKAAAEMGVDKAQVDAILKGYVRAGTGVDISKAAYQQGKAAAAAIGGARLRFSIPVLNIRAAGMRLPLIPSVMDFSMGRRFFAGISGQVRLMKMVGDGAATMEDMRIFWEKGFKGLKDLSPSVYRDLGKGVRSPFYTVSEGLGGITSHFSPHAKQLRGGGLAAKYAAEVKVQSRHILTQSIDEIQTVRIGGEGAAGQVLSPRQVAERIGVAVKNAGENATELGDKLNELRNLVPESGMSASDYWDRRISQFNLNARNQGADHGEEFENMLAQMRAQKDRAVKAEARVLELSGGDTELHDVWRQVAKNRDDIEVNAGLTPDTYNEQAQVVDDLLPDDAARYSDGETFISDQVSGSSSIGVDQVTDNGATGVPLRGVRSRPQGRLGDPAPSMRDVQAEQAARGGLDTKAEQAAQDDFAARLNAAADEKAASEARARLGHPDPTPIGDGRELSPIERFMANLDEATQRAVADTLDGLTPEELAFRTQPRLVATGPRRTLTIDRRAATRAPGEVGTKATEVIDEVAEIQDSIRPLLDDIEQGTVPHMDELSDEANAELRRIVSTVEGKEAQLADITTFLLKQRGYTDVRILTDQGEELVTFFDEASGTVPLARVNPRAAALEDHGGSQLRAITSGAREAIQGVNRRKNERLIQQILRAVRNSPREEAERKAQEMLREAGIKLRPNQAFFETNPLNILEEASNESARRVSRQFVGEAARHAENLGLTRGGFGASPVGIGRYRVVLSDTGVNLAQAAGEQVAAAANVISRLADETGLPALQRIAQQMADEHMAVEDALNELNTYAPARLTSILQTIRRNTTEEEFLGAGATRELPTGATAPGNPHRLTLGNTADTAEEAAAKKAAKQKAFDAGTDESYGYHFGPAQNMGETRARGLRPGESADVTPPGPPGVYFGSTAKEAYDGLPMRNAKDTVLYRVKRDVVGMRGTERGPGFERELLSDETVPPQAIEYLDADGNWKPLTGIDRSEFDRAAGAQLREDTLAAEKAVRARKLDQIQKLIDGIAEAGDQATRPWRVVGESKVVPGGRIILLGDTNDLGQGLTYALVDENGKVLSARAMGSSLTDNVERTVNGVWTRPGYERQGLAGELAKAHWDDVGITSGTWDEQFDKMARAISMQEFTGSGAGQAEKYVKARAKEIKAQARKQADELAKKARKAEQDLQAASVEYQEATNELNRLTARTQTDRAPALAALVPAEDAMNLTGMATLRLPGFEEFSMPAFMAEEFEGAMHGFPKLEGAHLAFRQFNNWWKQFATWLVPGFHMRNIQGAFFNNWLGGVGMRDYITSSRIRYAERELAKGKPAKWATMRIADKDKELIEALRYAEPSGYVMGRPIEDLTYADLAQLSAGLNLTASNGRVFAEAMLTAEEQARRAAKAAKGKKGYLRRIPAPYTKLMRGTGTMTENVFRTAAFVRGLREGRSLMESRAFTMMRHGDYEDMTDTEYMWVRDLIPFYKWMRTNTPFQIHQLLESPGKLLAVQKGQQALYAAKGLDYEKERHRMPDWMGEGFTIPYNVGKSEEGLTVYDTVMLDLPMSDLFMGGREFVSSFLPTIRPFLESYITHQQTFSGAPLEGKQMVMNPLLAPLAPVLDAVGLVSRGKDGQMYMSDQTNNLLGALPLYSRFKSFIMADESAVKKRSNMVASAIFGFQMRPVDEQTLSSTELSFYYDQVLPTVEALKAQGYPLPTTADLEATVGTTDQILTSLGIQPGPVGAQAA